MSERTVYIRERSGEMALPEVEVVKVSDGLGFGVGTGSAEAVRSQAGEAALAAADAVITSPAILTKISTDERDQPITDDGCGDGRGVKQIFRGLARRMKSLNRAKVFGGGATMALADMVGSGEAGAQPLEQLFGKSMAALGEKSIDFGAHTAEHAAAEGCGCGAIDGAPAIIEYAAGHPDELSAALQALGVDTKELPEVCKSFADYAAVTRDIPYSGRAVMDEIAAHDKIIKELAGEHKEARIVLNFVRGYTVDQAKVRQVSSGGVEVFAVDMWRIQDIAEGLHPDNTGKQQRAYLSMLVYTLATAAVLTKGDMPVYVAREA